MRRCFQAFIFFIAITGLAIAQKGQYPAPVVVDYVNIDSKEVGRQKTLHSLGLQHLSPVILPQGKLAKKSVEHGALSSHFGWPHAVMLDNVIIVHVKNLFLLRSTNRGKTWEKPFFVKNAPIIVMTATKSGKIIAISIDREPGKSYGIDRTISVLISNDKGKTWSRSSAPVQLPMNAQGLTSRIIEHPRFGLVTGVHYNTRKDTLTFLVSKDEGINWRAVNVPTGHPLDNNGMVLFDVGRNGIGAIVRDHSGMGGEYLQNWTSAMQYVPTNIESAKDFEDLKWLGVRSNIWLRKEDCYSAQYNPVSKRIEAVATKREWGVPQIDSGYMTLNLWSISPEAFRRGDPHWRLEGTLLRSKGEKARVINSRDGFHPAGTVIDTLQGLQHIYFYSGNRSHGGDGAPESGSTGIFSLSRTLDTRKWVEYNRKLEDYESYAAVSEDFDNLSAWQQSGSPTDRMILMRTEPAYRMPVQIPTGLVETRNGNLFLKTGEPGYYGLHRAKILATVNFIAEFRARIGRFPQSGYPLGFHVNVGAEKFDFIIKHDGIYSTNDNGRRLRMIAAIANSNIWYTWRLEMKQGHAAIYRDGVLVANISMQIDITIGHRPLTVSAMSTSVDDFCEMEMDYFKFWNVDMPDETSVRNSLGMEMLRIEPGIFRRGNEGEIPYRALSKDELHTPYLAKGDPNPYINGGPVMQNNPLEWDEYPAHTVKITKPYYISSTPVTNAQYEQFDPAHRALRGKEGFSTKDNDAVLYVSWDEAVAFTKWLSKKEGVNYRLPTEAEWEYAARAGTATAYFTGDTLPREYWHHQLMNRSHSIVPENVNLAVAQTPANAWGLHDIHGLVEEWCTDWYGPYQASMQTDPLGVVNGIARITRGGSHSTGLPFLRSANRSAALPSTRSFLIGFRVVRADEPAAAPTHTIQTPKWALGVKQQNLNWQNPRKSDRKPVFEKPKTYTRVAPGSNGPLHFIHNHEPALSVLPNGDLLAIWFTTTLERGREMVIAASRLRRGSDQWDDADLFFQVADRNLTGQALWWDGDQTIYHFSGVGVGDDWKKLSLIMRTSTDNGVSWTAPQVIGSEFKDRQQAIDAVIKTSDGTLVLLCDASWAGDGGTAVLTSKDNGKTWMDTGKDKPRTAFDPQAKGHTIAGIHAGIVELNNGDWMALGRGDKVNGKMPMSISKDKGYTWEYSASPFEPIGGAQRLAFMRLKEGPLLLVTFQQQMGDIVSNKQISKGIGMFAALSYDEGKTWPVKKLITSGEGSLVLDAPCNLRWGVEYSLLDSTHAERRGYLTIDQAPDGMIHLLSSGTHYSFNLAWLESHN